MIKRKRSSNMISKNLKNFIISIFLLLVLPTNAEADFFDWINGLFGVEKSPCPKVSLKTPKCPKGSSRILDDTYPHKAIVISNAPNITNNNSYQTLPSLSLRSLEHIKVRDMKIYQNNCSL